MNTSGIYIKPESDPESGKDNRSSKIRLIFIVTLHLTALIGILWLIFSASLQWVSATNSNLKMLWLISCILLVILEFFVGFSILNLSKQIRSGQKKLRMGIGMPELLPKFKDLNHSKRVRVFVYSVPGLFAIDLSLGFLTIILIRVLSTILFIKQNVVSGLWIVLVILALGYLYILYFNLSFIHWVITGRPVKSVRDLMDWSKSS